MHFFLRQGTFNMTFLHCTCILPCLVKIGLTSHLIKKCFKMFQKKFTFRKWVLYRQEVSIRLLAEAAHKTSSGCPQQRKMWKKEIHIGPNGKSINRKEEKTTETWRGFRIFFCTVLNNLTLMKNQGKKIRKLYLLQKRNLPWHTRFS